MLTSITARRLAARARAPRIVPLPLAVALLAALAAAGVGAQDKPPEKKLYCWEEGGRKVCGDALPPSAVNQRRTEINVSSGMVTQRMERALTGEELARQKLAQAEAEAQAKRDQRDMAMVVSYGTEADLERAFRNRFELLDESIKTSDLALQNLHLSLLALLRQANTDELSQRPVNKRLLDKIRTQHEELDALRALRTRQRLERTALDAQFKQALERYRALKQDPAATAAATLAPAAPTASTR